MNAGAEKKPRINKAADKPAQDTLSPLLKPKGSKESALRMGKLIREARMARHISQVALASDMNMTKNLVNNWESGLSRPGLDLIPFLCEKLGISIFDMMGMEPPKSLMELPEDEEKLLKDYRLLDSRHRRLVSDMIHTYALGYTEDYIENLKELAIGLTETEMAYAAGFGDFNLMEDENETSLGFYRSNRVPSNADFVASVTGNSMLPTFQSGDRVFVEKTPVVDVGDIGLFVLNGEGLIKEYHRDGLYSHNKRAKTKKFHEGDAFYVIGKVIRKVEPEDCFSAAETEDIWKLYREGGISVKASAR